MGENITVITPSDTRKIEPMLRPIGNRILVKPEANDETTESGLILVEHRKPPVMGTVVAVGPCPHPLKAEAEELARKVEALSYAEWAHEPAQIYGTACEEVSLLDAANMLRDLTRKEPLVKAGDLVVFSWTAGREVTINDDLYLMMTEDDILAVIEP